MVISLKDVLFIRNLFIMSTREVLIVRSLTEDPLVESERGSVGMHLRKSVGHEFVRGSVGYTLERGSVLPDKHKPP